MSSAYEKNKLNSQRFFAVLLILFLFLMYKESVWDRYFNPQAAKNAEQQASQQVAEKTAAKDAANKITPETFAVPSDLELKSEALKTADLKANVAGVTATESETAAYPTDPSLSSAGKFEVETDAFIAQISLLGGRLTDFRLKDITETIKSDSPLYNLISHIEFAPYPLGVYSGTADDSKVKYEVRTKAKKGDVTTYHVQADDERFELVGTLADGRTITKALTFKRQGYIFDLDILLSAPSPDASRVSVEWTRYVDESPSLLDPYNVSSYVWYDGNKVQREPLTKLNGESAKGTPSMHQLPSVIWSSLGDKYFTTSFLNVDGTSPAVAIKTGPLYRLRISGGDVSGNFQIFAGPKEYKLLESIGHHFELNVDFGIFGVISAPLLALMRYFYSVFGNYALAIVLLTILVKLALYPLNSAAYRSMRKMQKLAPELKKLRETVKDKQQQQLKMMEMYKKHGVNPFGGCFPMLAQMPIFIGLYSALMSAVELRHAPFALWIHDLSAKEALMVGGFGIPVMVILMVITMLIQQMMTPVADPAQKKMMMFMPFIFGFMFSGFPAGLTLYWLTNNIVSIVQQRTFYTEKGKGHGVAITFAACAAVFSVVYIMTLIG